MSETIRVNMYSAELYDKKGNGNVNLRCKPEEEAGIREEQKEKNRLYKAEKLRLKDEKRMEIRTGRKMEAVQENEVNLERQIGVDCPITPFVLHLDEGTGNTCVIIGSSKMGKSTLLMNLYNTYADKKKISTLFAVNDHIKIYKDKYLLKFPMDLENSSAGMAKYIKLQKRINKASKNKYEFYNFIDDLIDIRFNKIINNSILTLRNSKISTFMCLQYGGLLSKMGRANMNNVILFGLNTDEAIEFVVKVFLKSIFKKMGIVDMISFYKKCTSDHQFIYYRPADETISFHRLSI